MNILNGRTAALTALVTATALSALTGPPSHGAVPAPEPIGHVVSHLSPTSTPDTHAQDRPCFLWRAHWNASLDGPEPTCPLPTNP
jgi:hypothetical protein